ncbi:hemerythrin domain-containing protein [Paenibacillus sp. y28]|uniref:hemerythrin domain-containing protein n=1 Tax=Paenibacillus sp. y28 TaxID=3129110 RepID=UPI0030187A3B
MRQPATYHPLYTPVVYPLYQLNEWVQRLEEEHMLLKERLEELHVRAQAVGLDEKVVNWAGALRDLKQRAAAFRTDLDQHLKWEEAQLFPLISWYFDEELAQFTLMKQEHELAEQFFDAYFEPVERITRPVSRPEAQELASYLLQMTAVMRQHFAQEEEIIAALADRSNGFGF